MLKLRYLFDVANVQEGIRRTGEMQEMTAHEREDEQMRKDDVEYWKTYRSISCMKMIPVLVLYCELPIVNFRNHISEKTKPTGRCR